MKSLNEMSLEELWQLFPIILEKHNPNYNTWYKEEKTNLLNTLRDHDVKRINHIGSTAVENIMAKPIIDILLELPPNYEMSEIIESLTNSDWLVMAQNEEDKTIDLNKGYTPQGFAEKVFHLHIKPEGDCDELYFRDYLKQYPDVAKEYEVLKLELMKHYEHDRDAYTDAKSDFISKYTELARQEFPNIYLRSILKTSRMILRPWKESDAEYLYEFAKDSRIGPISGWPVHTSVDNSLQIIRDVLSRRETYTVTLIGDDIPIGSVGLMIGKDSNIDISDDEAEIGYWIGVPYWGQGLIPEAVEEILRHAFIDLKLSKIWCGYFIENNKSKRVSEKCGFRLHRTEYNVYYPQIDLIKTQCITFLTKEEWSKRRNENEISDRLL